MWCHGNIYIFIVQWCVCKEMHEDVYVKPQVFRIEPYIIFTKIKIPSLSISFLQMYSFLQKTVFVLAIPLKVY